MYIVDQDRSNVVNIGNIKSIALNGKRITADDYTLAAYDTEQRGKEVFEQLLGNAFPPDMIVAKNCNISEDAVKDLAMDHSIIMVRGNGQADVTAYSCGVYYMPEAYKNVRCYFGNHLDCDIGALHCCWLERCKVQQ